MYFEQSTKRNTLWRSSQVEEIEAIIFMTQNGPEGIRKELENF